jgi:S-adenosylmethionine-diacylglycerol 3-amino-3-carboxypropyl transferase
MPSRAEEASEERLAYAVIREDARLEGDLVNRIRAKRVLTVASGGCVALSLSSRFPGLEVTAFDTSRAQLDHLAKKADAARARDLVALNVENASSRGLNQCGELEKVFRLLRAFFEEFIASHGELLTFFTRGRPLIELDRMVLRWTTSRYWRAAFHACFTDVLLKTTLGAQPLRHAEEGTHPAYFQRAFERGLRRDGAPENPFLQHVFLGGYRRGCEPHYIRHGGALAIERVHGTLLDVPDLERFDIVSLSNLFDWLSDEETARWAAHLKAKLRPGAAVLIRQLNNTRKLRPFFEPEFRFDGALGRSYFLRDRSLFYNRIEVGTRQAESPRAVVPDAVVSEAAASEAVASGAVAPEAESVD